MSGDNLISIQVKDKKGNSLPCIINSYRQVDKNIKQLEKSLLPNPLDM